MVTPRLSCLFCFADGHLPKLTREHVISRPVAEAFGVDRTAGFLQFSLTADDKRVGTIEGLAVRVVCAGCNNGWMNELEHGMTRVAAWVEDADRPLGEALDLALRSWALKTHLLLCFLEGNARRAGDSDVEGVLPNYSSARQLYERDLDSIRALPVGLAKPDEPDHFGYAFGTPKIVPVGPKYAGPGSATASIVTLGPIQMWFALSLRPAAQITVPGQVKPVSPELRFADLGAAPVLGELDTVVIDHGEHNIHEELKALLEWASGQDGKQTSRDPVSWG